PVRNISILRLFSSPQRQTHTSPECQDNEEADARHETTGKRVGLGPRSRGGLRRVKRPITSTASAGTRAKPNGGAVSPAVAPVYAGGTGCRKRNGAKRSN